MRFATAVTLCVSFLSQLVPGAVAVGAPGSCKNPIVRKEWRALTKAEKANWISAVRCLATLPTADYFQRESDGGSGGVPRYNKSGSLYDDFVYLHIDRAYPTHGTGLFFPWHRWYVQTYEDTLRAKCNLTTPSPYWDWRKDSSNVRTSPMFSDIDPESGIGGWGVAANDFQLTEGGFAGFPLSYPNPHVLRRNYTETLINKGVDTGQNLLEMITKEKVDIMINMKEGEFQMMQAEMEKLAGSHTAGHFVIGGDLAGLCPGNALPECQLAAGNPMWSANEPLFWLHHGMVDRVWSAWQDKSVINANAFAGGSVRERGSLNGGPPMLELSSPMPSGNLGPAATIGEVMSTTGGFLCYVYE